MSSGNNATDEERQLRQPISASEVDEASSMIFQRAPTTPSGECHRDRAVPRTLQHVRHHSLWSHEHSRLSIFALRVWCVCCDTGVATRVLKVSCVSAATPHETGFLYLSVGMLVYPSDKMWCTGPDWRTSLSRLLYVVLVLLSLLCVVQTVLSRSLILSSAHVPCS